MASSVPLLHVLIQQIGMNCYVRLFLSNPVSEMLIAPSLPVQIVNFTDLAYSELFPAGNTTKEKQYFRIPSIKNLVCSLDIIHSPFMFNSQQNFFAHPDFEKNPLGEYIHLLKRELHIRNLVEKMSSNLLSQSRHAKPEIDFGFLTHFSVLISHLGFTRALKYTPKEAFFWDIAVDLQLVHVNFVVVFLAESKAQWEPSWLNYNSDGMKNATFCWSNRINFRLVLYNFNCIQLTSITQSMFIKNTYGRNVITWQNFKEGENRALF